MQTWLEKQLWNQQDKAYQQFHSRLVPTLNSKTIIGVRVPQLRKIAKEFMRREECSTFLDTLPHNYYEENMIHGIIISKEKDYQTCVMRLNQFLPYVDNWAVCDGLSPTILKAHPKEAEKQLQCWIKTKETYTIRFGIGMYLSYYLDEYFKKAHLKQVSDIYSEEYYVNMMIAWYFATALAKQWDATIPYLEKKKLSPWVHNKTIQKAIESYRITNQQKEYLRTLRVK